MMSRHRQGERHRIGQPYILAGQNHQPTRDKPRVFPTRQHLSEPIHCRIGSTAAATFDEGRDRIVVLVFIGIIANATLTREDFKLGRGDCGTFGETEYNYFQRIQGPTQIAVAQFRQIHENFIIRRAMTCAQTMFSVTQCAEHYSGDCIGRQRFKPEQMTTRKQRRIHVKTGVVRSRADQAHGPLLHIGEQ